MLTLHEGVFELFVVKDELASEEQVEKALKEQRRRRKQGRKVGLDELLVEMGVLSEEQVESVRSRIDEDVIPGYRLHEELGRGGMGTVYRATQVSMERDVAIKILSRHLSRDETFCARFLQEARNAAKLNHENIMGGIDCGEAKGIHYFVMEFVDGVCLGDKVDSEGPLTVAEVFDILEQAAKGLKHAHDQKIVHRDVKPENMMRTRDGVLKICDLGLARPAVKAGEGEKGATCEGTPYYCAPEQALGRTDIDAAADIYALGSSAYHLLAGQVPFDGESARKILWHQVNTPFPDWREPAPDLTDGQLALLSAMVIKDRSKRIPTADVLLERLAELKAAPVVPASKRVGTLDESRSLPLVPIGAGLVIALALAGMMLFGGSKGDGKEPGTGEVAVTDPKPVTPTLPTGGGEPPPVVHVGDPPPVVTPTDPKPTTPSEGDLRERQAKRLLDEARQFEDGNPGDVEGALGRYRDVKERFAGTKAGEQADQAVARLVKTGRNALAEDFAALQKSAREAMDSGRFREAISLLERFRESHDARLVQAFLGKMKELRDRVTTLAQRELDAIKLGLESWAAKATGVDAEAFKPLDDFAARAPGELQAKVAELREDIAKRVQAGAVQKRADAVVASARARLAEGDLSGAQALLQASLQDPALASVKASIEAALVDLEGVAVVWRAFEASLAKLQEDTAVFPGKDGEERKATLRTYDPKTLELTLKIYGRTREEVLDLEELTNEFVMGLTPQPQGPKELVARIRFFMVRGLVEAALECFQEAKKLGVEDTALEAELNAALVEAKESAARRLVARLSEDRPADEKLRFARRLARSLSETQAYQSSYDVIVAAFVEARAALIVEEEPELLFAGEAKRTSQKTLKFKIDYEFKEEAEAADFLIDDQTIKGSKVTYKDRSLEITGRLQHVARWEGGSLELKMRLRTLNPDRPNINIMISDQGGYEGCFIGLGSRMKAREVTLDKDAGRRAGFKVDLPANLVADARGADWKYLFADRSPALKTDADRVIKVDLERTKRGTLVVKSGTRTYITLQDSPRAEESGHVGFYLDKVKLVLHEVSIEGTLDASWAVEHAAVVAQREADGFPKPAKPDAGKGKDKGKGKRREARARS